MGLDATSMLYLETGSAPGANHPGAGLKKLNVESTETRERIMAKVTSEAMKALADVADAVGKLRATLDAGTTLLHGLTGEVVLLSNHMTNMIMDGSDVPTYQSMAEERAKATFSKETQEAAAKIMKQKAGKPGRKPKVVTVTTATKNGDVVTRSEIPEAGETQKRKAGGKMGVCIDCGTSYLKTSNVQKRCPQCRQLKKLGPPKAAEPSAGADRLSRIKAIDKKLDTITD